MQGEIERLCQVIINIINERDFDYQEAEACDFRRHHVSPEWQGRLDELAWSMSFDEQTEFWRQMTTDFPGVYFKLVGVDCKVHENDRTADVVLRAAMIRGNLRLLTACDLKWKFSNGKWIWYYHQGMAGICEA